MPRPDQHRGGRALVDVGDVTEPSVSGEVEVLGGDPNRAAANTLGVEREAIEVLDRRQPLLVVDGPFLGARVRRCV
jgi:hypothetical protein